MALTYQQLLVAVPTVIKAGNVPSIVGDAGLGKTALVADVAQRMGAAMYTTVVSLVEKGDLAIPVPPLTSDSFVETQRYGRLANVQYGYSETLIRIVRRAENEPNRPIIWLLDEFNRGTQAVQSELMNLVLQRRVNSLQLPDSVHIVIAENPDNTMEEFADSDYGVTAGDAAIKDRTVRLVMRPSLTDWLQWANEQETGQSRIEPLVQEYLKEHPEQLAPRDHGDDLYPTPRAWERVSRDFRQLLKLPAKQWQPLAEDIFSGDLGTVVGVEFAEFVKQQGNELTVAKLLSSTGNQQFHQAAEFAKLAVLKSWIANNDHHGWRVVDHAALFLSYARQLSADGQFSLAQTVGESDQQVAEELIASENDDAQKLTEWLARVATRDDRGDDGDE